MEILGGIAVSEFVGLSLELNRVCPFLRSKATLGRNNKKTKGHLETQDLYYVSHDYVVVGDKLRNRSLTANDFSPRLLL